jgi:hypothetical protein
VLNQDINVMESCLTIAGQTAPSPGITLRNGGLNFYAHDVLVQHLRIRPGDGGPVQAQTAGHDGGITYSYNGYNPHHVVFDHVSLSWAGDKNTLVLAYGPANVTYWHCISSEALYYAKNVIVDPTAPSSLGMALGYSQYISVIGSLFAHNSDRNPEMGPGTIVQFINNVVYDWGTDTTAYPWASFIYTPAAPDQFVSIDIIGNTYIAGPTVTPFPPLYAVGTWGVNAGSRLFMSDNTIDQRRQPVSAYFQQSTDIRVSSPTQSGVTTRPSSNIESLVLADAGARPKDRDAVDQRIVSEVTSRSGRVISSQNDVGGWPTLAVNTRSLALPSNPHTVTSSGYTNLENWLHGMAAAVEASNQTATPPSPPTGVHVATVQ